jgi:hypothetical protein
MGTENTGFQQAYINGQPIRFEDSPTVDELREQGYIPDHHTIARDYGNGVTEGLTDDDPIEANKFFVTQPRFIWG